MRINRRFNLMYLLSFVFVAILLLIAASSAYAKIRTDGGGDVPFYARIERGEILHTDEWAPIIFYRPPGCVPHTFDLLDFFDAPAAFECIPPTTDGFIIWDGEPWVSNPIQIKLHNANEVPVWFVSWDELQVALADDELYITELAAMPSLLVGSASYYEETMHPTEGANVPMIQYNAQGTLQDGRSFKVHVTFVTLGTPLVNVTFK